ncbi:MAG: CheY-like chemotaxis protein [Planctomycetota bacterium]|jgi:CheY-like chemotaxis protein
MDEMEIHGRGLERFWKTSNGVFDDGSLDATLLQRKNFEGRARIRHASGTLINCGLSLMPVTTSSAADGHVVMCARPAHDLAEGAHCEIDGLYVMTPFASPNEQGMTVGESNEPVPDAKLSSSAIRMVVIGDEPLVRDLIVKPLAREGIEVESFDGPIAALEKYRDGGRPIDLVIADIELPYMNGLKFVQKLDARHSGVRAIHMSGYAVASEAQERIRNAAGVYLSKPFSPRELLAIVRQPLRAGGQKGERAPFLLRS